MRFVQIIIIRLEIHVYFFCAVPLDRKSHLQKKTPVKSDASINKVNNSAKKKRNRGGGNKNKVANNINNKSNPVQLFPDIVDGGVKKNNKKAKLNIAKSKAKQDMPKNNKGKMKMASGTGKKPAKTIVAKPKTNQSTIKKKKKANKF